MRWLQTLAYGLSWLLLLLSSPGCSSVDISACAPVSSITLHIEAPRDIDARDGFALTDDGEGASHASLASSPDLLDESPPHGGRGPASGLVPIETVQVGDRVLSPGDDGVQDTPTLVGAEEEWRVVRVAASSPDDPSDTVYVTLLRPASWVEWAGARLGGWIPLTLGELGFDGYARVLAIERAPEVRAGPGHVVTMTVTHRNDTVMRLRLRGDGGATEWLEPTALHKLYSADQDGWVSTGNLRIGERLRTEAGAVTVEGIEARGSAQVFNFEVEAIHAYRVGRTGVWSHNSCTDGPKGAAGGVVQNGARGRAPEARVLGDMGLNKSTAGVTKSEGTSIPDALTDTLSVEVKDTARVSATRQVRIQTNAARANGQQSILVTGDHTRVSAPAQRAFDQVIRRSDLGPQK